MSLYNLINGYDPMAPVLLAMLRLNPKDIPRFRDCWWDGTHIVVYTRTGGPNRDYYESLESCQVHYSDHDQDQCIGPWNEDLRKLPTYVRDKDDTFDSTYANFYFSVPENMQWVIPELIRQEKTPHERMQDFLQKMHDQPGDPQVVRTMTAMEPLMREIARFLQKP